MQRTRGGDRGFTLVELLSVIGVLLTVAAVMLPVTARVREKGRQSACQSNLRQVYVGIQQYVQDNDSVPPLGDWRAATAAYVKEPRVFRCPSLSARGDNATGSGEYRFYTGFLNGLVASGTTPGSRPDLTSVNESVLGDTSRIFVSGDAPMHGFSRRVPMPRTDACGVTDENGRAAFMQTAPTVHNDGGNYLFYDGHAKWMNPEMFTQALCDAAPYLHSPFRTD